MKKKLVWGVPLVAFATVVTGCPNPTVYGGPDEERAFDVQALSDGGYVFAGHRGLNASDGYLIRTDSAGALLWEATYTVGPDTWEQFYSVLRTSDGGFIACGTHMTCPGCVTSDMYVVKTSSTGAVEWFQTFGDASNGVRGACEEVVAGSDGGYFLVGRYLDISIDIDVWVVKIDSSGVLQWDARYNDGDKTEGRAATAVPNVGIAIGGSSNPFVPWQSIPYLLMIEEDGTQLWQTTNFPGVDPSLGSFEDVQPTPDGGLLLGGSVWPSAIGIAHMYLVKTDSGGVQEWSKIFKDATPYNGAEGSGVALSPDGGYVIVGSNRGWGLESYAFMVKTDTNGAELWRRAYNDVIVPQWPFIPIDVRGFAVRPTADGGYIVGGTYRHTLWEVTMSYDAYAVKTDSSGQKLW